MILIGDVMEKLRELPDESVNCIVTSPPYWGLRDYGVEGQIGLEATHEEHAEVLVQVFREARRVLREDGTLWLNYGDCYATKGDSERPGRRRDRESVPGRASTPGLKPKDLVGMPWRIAFALQADGWWLRSDIIWSKPNPMPESVTDRPTKAHEYLFLLAKSPRYYYDADAIRLPHAPKSFTVGTCPVKEGAPDNDGGANLNRWLNETGHGRQLNPKGANRRSVWEVATQPFAGAHFATFPPELIRPCVIAGCPEGGTVLDPFFGAGTTGLVCDQEGRNWIGIELNPEYAAIAQERLMERQNLIPMGGPRT